MSRVAFVSDKNLAGLFRSFGIDAVVFNENENPAGILGELAAKDYGIIYILERFARGFIKEIEAVRKRAAVSIVIVPDHLSDFGLGMELARLATIDAIGTDAVFAKGEK